MYIVQEQDVIGDRTEAPYARVVKHLVAPWNAESTKIWMGITIVDAGSASNPHAHDEQEEVFFCLGGQGLIRVGDQEEKLSPGSCIFIPEGAVHQMVNTQPDDVLRVLSATAPAFSRGGWSVVHSSQG